MLTRLWLSYLFSFGSMFQRCQNPTKLTRAYLIIMPEPGLLFVSGHTYAPLLLLRLVLDKVKRLHPHAPAAPTCRMHLVAAAATTHMLLMSASRRVRFWSRCVVATGVHYIPTYVLLVCDSLLLF